MFGQEKIGIFVDGANMYAAAKMLEQKFMKSFEIDYAKLVAMFNRSGYVVDARYYTAVYAEGDERNTLKPLLDWLSHHQWTVVTKQVKEYNNTGRPKIKGNMDIEITVDVLDMCTGLNRVVLCSGDGDFKHLIRSLQRRCVRTTVISTVRTTPPMCENELRKLANEYKDLMDLAPAVCRD